jgi:hypothetical protein
MLKLVSLLHYHWKYHERYLKDCKKYVKGLQNVQRRIAEKCKMGLEKLYRGSQKLCEG